MFNLVARLFYNDNTFYWKHSFRLRTNVKVHCTIKKKKLNPVILKGCCKCLCCFQGQLREAIRDMVLRCTQTLFIFDEAEKLHSGLINAIKPYMDHYDNVDGVNYRGAIFLFLRSVGSKNKRKKRVTHFTLDSTAIMSFLKSNALAGLVLHWR